MRNISIRIRLGLLVVLSLLGTVIVGSAGIFGVQRLVVALDEIQQRSMPAVVLVMELRAAQLKSVLISREGESWNPDVYEGLPSKGDAVAEARSLFASILERREDADRLAEQAFRQYEALPKSVAEQQQWDKVKVELKAFHEVYDELHGVTLDLRDAKDWYAVRSGTQRYKDLEYPLGGFLDRLEVEIEALRKMVREHADTVAADATRAKYDVLVSIGGISIVSAFLLLLLMFFIVRSVTKALQQLRSTIMAIAHGNDFRLRAEVGGRDELAQTAVSFNDLLESVQGSLREVRGCVEGIARAAGDASAAATSMSESSTRQSEVASTMAAAIEEVTASIGDVSGRAQVVRTRALQSGQAAEAGMGVMLRAAERMEQIHHALDSATAAIQVVHDQSGQIASVTNVIREVADQTNLLALNAAIEAARAGEQGRGFAVVADEVRQLAERTAGSTVDIRMTVTTMQASVSEAASGMEAVVVQAQDGRQLSSAAAEHVVDIRQQSQEVTEAITGVASALAEQSLAVEGIAREIEAMAQMSREHQIVAGETTQISEVLQASALALNEAVSRFRV